MSWSFWSCGIIHGQQQNAPLPDITRLLVILEFLLIDNYCSETVVNSFLHVPVVIFVSAAIPLTFKSGLKNQEAPEGGNVCLRCELSRAGVPVQWWKGEDQLCHGGRVQMALKGKSAEMTIRNIQPEDVGEYSCVFGGQKTTAEVNVRGIKNVPFLIPFYSI